MIDAAPSDSPSMSVAARTRSPAAGRLPGSSRARRCPPCSRPELVMKSAVPTTVTVRPAVGVADQRAVVAAWSRGTSPDCLVGVAERRTAPRPRGSASRSRSPGRRRSCAVRRSTDLRRERLPGPRHRLDQQTVAGQPRPVAAARRRRRGSASARSAAGSRAAPPVRPRRCRRRRPRRRRGRAAE